MVFALALAVALSYGAADFCGGLASRRASAPAVVVWSQALGLVGLVLLLAVLPPAGGALHRSDLLWSLVCGGCGALAIGLLYRGLAIGLMGVVSPITAVLAAAVPVTWSVARGERPAMQAAAGIVLALVAVALVSAAGPAGGAPRPRAVRPRRLPPGIPAALGAGLGFGCFFIALAQTHADAGLSPLLVARTVSVALLFGAALGLRQPLRVARPALATTALCGALDMAANVLYVLAVHRGSLGIVAVLSSLYPAATVGLAGLVLRERLLRIQWAGVGMALAGVLCISLAR